MNTCHKLGLKTSITLLITWAAFWLTWGYIFFEDFPITHALTGACFLVFQFATLKWLDKLQKNDCLQEISRAEDEREFLNLLDKIEQEAGERAAKKIFSVFEGNAEIANFYGEPKDTCDRVLLNTEPKE